MTKYRLLIRMWIKQDKLYDTAADAKEAGEKIAKPEDVAVMPVEDTMFVVRAEVLDALLADKEWRKRWDSTKTMAERERVVSDFCRATGWKVK